MLIRIRSRDGNFRFEFNPKADVSELLEKIIESSPNANRDTVTISNQPRGNEAPISTLLGKSLEKLGLKHGDLVFVNYKPREDESAAAPPPASTPAASSSTSQPSRLWETVQEDPVDTYWRSKDGMIPRGRDAQFCKHGAKGMCDYCMPLEPYDAKYHKEQNIKHLSYHAYVRKLTPKSTLSSSASLPPLEPISYKVKIPCPTGDHPSWPEGICTGCQPSAITLQSPAFRMVDHLEIANMEIVDRFLQAWRKTGLQRFGWMIGHYEPYDKVPMGIKAVVEAICEPPQEGELDGLTLGLPWEDETRIRQLSANAATPLTIVGYVFTDLVPDEEDRTKTQYRRHPGSFYLSSLEAIFAARMQLNNPTKTRSSSTGMFGSRLVTAVLTGTEDGAIDVSAYQVSEQACAMVEADMIEASVDPGIVRVKEEDRSVDNARYIPDVFFSYKNEYNIEVKKSAKPCFPVEYLLVNVTHGFPQAPEPMFQSIQFPIENRQGLEDQTVDGVLGTLARLDAPNIMPSIHAPAGESPKRTELARYLSDWHLVSFLETTQLMSVADIKLMTRTVSRPMLLREPALLDPVLQCEGWQTLMTFTRESAPPSRPQTSAPSGSNAMDEDIPPEVFDQIAASDAQGGGGGGPRICPHCTFENYHGGSDCEVCGLPL
ncbi:NPL4 family-domain-containing protein [Schizophyllum amplum]|uniref:Nuclear protein localization protein 4 n=1 Tax=Schizophyllum amplum TaxID=97359 RepID=A0A550CMH1_9AGAR|nr:NPL4 family-domain-containing protein [Auriculariopsis ampla]